MDVLFGSCGWLKLYMVPYVCVANILLPFASLFNSIAELSYLPMSLAFSRSPNLPPNCPAFNCHFDSLSLFGQNRMNGWAIVAWNATKKKRKFSILLPLEEKKIIFLEQMRYRYSASSSFFVIFYFPFFYGLLKRSNHRFHKNLKWTAPDEGGRCFEGTRFSFSTPPEFKQGIRKMEYNLFILIFIKQGSHFIKWLISLKPSVL